MARPIERLELTAEERAELERRLHATIVSKRDSLRASIVLLRADGCKEKVVARRLRTSMACVSKWSKRFSEDGLEGLRDRPGRGRKPWLPVDRVAAVLDRLPKPPPGRTRWSTRYMARSVGLSPSSVHQIWRRNDIKPHQIRTFKLSRDPHFKEKFWDVIGLYLNPPDKSLLLCCDEKSQCQALERTQPGLPLGVGHIRTHTHDYYRHGTLTLFAALNYLEGKVVARTEVQHTHVEWLRFLKQIDREMPKDVTIHLIMDNYCTHKEASVKAWLARKQERFHVHFTPTGSSWMNLVERFFRDITQDVIREGSFESVRELSEAIITYLADRNEHPKPYRWKAKGEEILAKIQRAREAQAKAAAAANA
ncbi:MAG TPA: IS630 family transposase [Candidatus Paceibacterota bacterium]|nr:IS630 family transposase [Candidatus Paceibacterota bacterium]